MKEEIKKGFENALAMHEARAQATKLESERKTREREQFKSDWRRICQEVITPALQQVVEQTLKPNGWQCRISSNTDEVALESYKGDMRGIGGSHTRPQLSFKIDDHSGKVTPYMSTRSQGGGDAGFRLSEINEELVQSLALKFVQRLVGESGSYGSTY